MYQTSNKGDARMKMGMSVIMYILGRRIRLDDVIDTCLDAQ